MKSVILPSLTHSSCIENNSSSLQVKGTKAKINEKKPEDVKSQALASKHLKPSSLSPIKTAKIANPQGFKEITDLRVMGNSLCTIRAIQILAQKALQGNPNSTTETNSNNCTPNANSLKASEEVATTPSSTSSIASEGVATAPSSPYSFEAESDSIASEGVATAPSSPYSFEAESDLMNMDSALDELINELANRTQYSFNKDEIKEHFPTIESDIKKLMHRDIKKFFTNSIKAFLGVKDETEITYRLKSRENLEYRFKITIDGKKIFLNGAGIAPFYLKLSYSRIRRPNIPPLNRLQRILTNTLVGVDVDTSEFKNLIQKFKRFSNRMERKEGETSDTFYYRHVRRY